MAVNSHILSYVHQHSLQYLAGARRDSPDAPAGPVYTKRDTPQSQFPFNQCSNACLCDTRRSVGDGVRNFVHNPNKIWILNGLREGLPQALLPTSIPTVPSPSSSFSINLSIPQDSATKCSLESSNVSINPILIRNPDTLGRNLLMSLVNDILMSLLRKKAGLTTEELVDPLIIEAVTYATNVFMQSFLSSSTHELCHDILTSKKSGRLNEILVFTLDELFEKHELLAFDRFHDGIVESVQGKQKEGQSPVQQPDHPKYYAHFRNIWRFNPGAFLLLSFKDVLSYRAEPDSSFGRRGHDNGILLQYEETAVMMNLVSCYHYLRRELRQNPQPKTELTPEDLKQLEVLLEAAVQYHLRTLEEEEPKTAKVKTKSLRFIGV
ncbi:hypothetical protein METBISCDRAFT_22725 [Metschnikowia bicuspidata]|uniref:Uncharacterized protein n=1 Tax=Metschnikowia bicuspidata TaxID=27322 RepID=A0A4P9ZF28_9ASCO|nr:hypothetical protein METBISCDRAFT_22725 [Metschnikowia bicuspidata]